jgi:hypothetical protein
MQFFPGLGNGAVHFEVGWLEFEMTLNEPRSCGADGVMPSICDLADINKVARNMAGLGRLVIGLAHMQIAGLGL